MGMIVIDLLDSDQGKPLQSWHFQGQAVITIGRAPDNDVIVADPYVSRAHAYLRQEPDHWQAVSISNQQLVAKGRGVAELALTNGTIFRLGPRGCSLRFSELAEIASNSSTMTFDPAAMPIFQLDIAQLEQEVQQITDGDYFQQLKQAAQKLRGHRALDDTQIG
jgi:hypothetical protein